MLPEVETFNQTIDAAAETYAEECTAATNEWRRAQNATTERIYNIRVNAAGEISKIRTDRAWELLAASQNRLIAWIGKNCRDNDDEARTVLEHLPLDYEGLIALADDRDWCTDVFDPYLRRAVADGAITGPATTPARADLIEWIADELSRSDIITLNKYLDAIVAEAVGAARKTWSEEQAATAQATDAENPDHGTFVVDLPEAEQGLTLGDTMDRVSSNSLL